MGERQIYKWKTLSFTGHRGNANRNHNECHLPPIRRAKIKARVKAGEDGESSEGSRRAVGMHDNAAALENRPAAPQRVERGVPARPSSLLRGKWRHASTPKARSTTQDGQKAETATCPSVDAGMNKTGSSHMLEGRPAIKSDKGLTHATWMNLEHVVLRGRRQTLAFLRSIQSGTIYRDRKRLTLPSDGEAGA